ncbi:hypothetical protein [Azospirillum agricola]|uniref:hypothetical protein n=1 Tax=Azospirillum agricola TaxID=1720247 RepID=UPI000A0F160C|nr:hypothetical protein [Azospirillum agricola]SMH41204.1 hypothetical protein SAMN02982994_1672 [Azospirillum lipoferum]
MTQGAVDILIPVGPNDRELAEICARAARQFVTGARNIYIVSAVDPGVPGTRFFDEAKLPFSIADIRQTLGIGDRAGWYFQQLVKFYFPFVNPDCSERYLVIDADTVFLRPCNFIEDGRVLFNFGFEFHPPYFEHMANLHPSLQKGFIHSGITHCMMFTRSWLLELMGMVQNAHKRGPFWKIFLDCVPPGSRGESGASEYETYFNFCLRWHPNEIVIKRLRWGNVVDLEGIQPDRADYISLHWHKRSPDLTRETLIEKVFGPRTDALPDAGHGAVPG